MNTTRLGSISDHVVTSLCSFFRSLLDLHPTPIFSKQKKGAFHFERLTSWQSTWPCTVLTGSAKRLKQFNAFSEKKGLAKEEKERGRGHERKREREREREREI